MTSPLSPESVAQMVADREAGTPGPWHFDGPVWNQIIWTDGENRLCFMAHSNGLNDDRDIANARRISRLPYLEAAYLTLAAENATLRAELREDAMQYLASVGQAMDLADEARASEAAALERVTALEAALANPVAVHANMLRGTIANPTPDQIIHLYGVDALCKALAPMIVREALEPTEYERKVAQMKEDFPNGI